MRDGFVSFARGEWQMPPKVYLPSPPGGDFRAMPVRGEGLAILKWITSFPGNPRRGLPTVTGVMFVSDADNGEPLAMLDARAVTALRTGAAAAVAAQELAREDAPASGWSAAGCTACGSVAAWPTPSTGPGVCFDPDPEAAGDGGGRARLGGRRSGRGARLRHRLHDHAGRRAGRVRRRDLRPGQHLNLLGADGPGKAEASIDAIARDPRSGPAVLRRVGARPSTAAS